MKTFKKGQKLILFRNGVLLDEVIFVNKSNTINHSIVSEGTHYAVYNNKYLFVDKDSLEKSIKQLQLLENIKQENHIKKLKQHISDLKNDLEISEKELKKICSKN